MITLLIPTINRSDFLIRLLRYYEDVGFDGSILIGDASGPEHVERTKRVIGTLSGTFTVIYKEYPGLHVTKCIKRLLDLVSTPYAAFSGDDDFLIPNALNKCIKFLNEHPDYAFAHGNGVNIVLNTKGTYGQIVDCSCYQQDEIDSESASQRLDYYLRYSRISIFSVHRTENLRLMYRDCYQLEDNAFGSELIPCCYSVILGKSKRLDCFHVVRTHHAQQVNQLTGFDWVTHPNWYSGYQFFHDILAGALAQKEGISIGDAQKVIKHAFCGMLSRPHYLCSPCGLSSGLRIETDYDSWVRIGQKIPGAQRIWQFLHSFSGVSLSALLRSSSPYHADFMPVYNALTKPPEEFSDQSTGK